jgi:hypothetical protein
MKIKLVMVLCIYALLILCFGQYTCHYVTPSNSFDATAFSNGHKIACPDLAMPNDTIHIVYHSSDSILYTFTYDAGQSWQVPAFIGTGNYPSIDVDLFGLRHVVWQKPDTITGNYDIYYDCLDDYSPALNISLTPDNSILPDVVVDTCLTAHIVWVEDVSSYNQVYYRTCNAGILGDTVRLSDYGTAEAMSTLPSISIFQPDRRVYALWDCYDPLCYSPYQIHSKYLEDSIWSATEVWASYLTLRHSSLDFDHGSDSLSAAWEDSTSGNLDAFFLGGNPGGGYSTSGLSHYPVVSTVGSIWSYLFWEDDSAGFEDIYFHLYYFMTGWTQGTIRSYFNINERVKYPSTCGSFMIWTQGESPPYDIYFADFGYPISIAESRNKIPHNVLKIQPNPFINKTTIIFDGTDIISIDIFDITGRLVKSFSIPTYYKPVSNSISWDGTDVTGQKLSAGTYFCVVKKTENKIIKKIIKLE